MDIDAIINHSYFTDLDRQFAQFIASRFGVETDEVKIAAALVSSKTGRGDVCLDLEETAGCKINFIIEDEEFEDNIKLPNLNEWIDLLKKSNIVGEKDDYKPLILHKSKLYLYRYYEYEKLLAHKIDELLSGEELKIDFDLLKNGLDRLFVNNNKNELDMQCVSAMTAVMKRFCVISGGPGTGKTSTVVKILVLLLEQDASLRIGLAAPTGKAAARLNEAVKQSIDSLDITEDIKKRIPNKSSTIHRLLGTIYGSPYFRYNKDNPLPYDVIVIDESSMTDLALMSKLFQSIPGACRVILLGDRDQLSSVEAGAVLGDICASGEEHFYSKSFIETAKEISDIDLSEMQGDKPVLSDSIMILNKSYRFSKGSGIGTVSRAICSIQNDEDAEEVLNLIADSNFPDIKIVDYKLENNFNSILTPHIINAYNDYFKAETLEQAFDLFSKFTVICALRNGPYGVVKINQMVEQILRKEDLIDDKQLWYNGRPVMIARNNYSLKLFNGDIGITGINEDGKPGVFFPGADNSVREVFPLKLPEHETVYAMTVHKSQGSEYQNVLLVLPDKASPVLTRELIYTAITRAQGSVEILGSRDILCSALINRVKRRSGLRNLLWNNS